MSFVSRFVPCLLGLAFFGVFVGAGSGAGLTADPLGAAREARPAGISGPGRPLAPGEAPTVSTRRTANTVVAAGLLPPIAPLLDLHVRDTVICLGGDGNYYLTGSTGANIWDFNEGVELWRSADLKNWSYIGLVWSVTRDGTWEKQPRDLHGKPTVVVWAPELHYLKKLNTYAIVLSMAPGGISILKSATGRPEGPYVNPVPGGAPLRAGGIDATLFEDDDGKVYFTNSGGGSISLMKDDLSGFAETRSVALLNPDLNPAHHAPKIVKRGMKGFGHEGAVLFKANGRYYHGAVDDYEGRYSSCVAVSDSVWGPYDGWHETVPCGGGTNFFEDKEGRWWCAFFGNDNAAPWRELPGIVRIEFAADGKISVARDQPFVSDPKWRAPPAAAPATNEILESALPQKNGSPAYSFAPGVKIPAGPAGLKWASIRQNYRVPQWLQDAKFGIFIHWGVYTVPAHHNEWYARHMYSNSDIIKWHAAQFGPQDKFGYKDFIPLFKAEQFDPAGWAALFKAAGARFVIPAAEHHDRFAMWDSKLTRWNAKNMGPKRDVIGELARAVRAEGMKYGVSNHRMFAYDFMVPAKGLKTDLYDPASADFYGPLPTEPKTLPTQAFCDDWLARTLELVDLYQPDFLWFDWDGTGEENPVKLQFAAYYFNRAAEWGKEVAFSQKGTTFPVGTGVPSHEKAGRMPKEITPDFWMVDDVISNRSWSYVEGIQYRTAASIVRELIDATSKNGALMLNISPRSDGVIPDEQQEILRTVGRWLAVNGEAIYGTRPWKQFSDGAQVRYTAKDGELYAILLEKPRGPVVLTALANGPAPRSVGLLGTSETLAFKQTPAGLTVTLPVDFPEASAYALKLTGPWR